MDIHNVAAQDAKLKRDEDAIAVLQDAVPQLDTLFIISHAIGHGTFSSVYFARTKHTTTINGRKHFAVKHIIPTSHPSRVFMEVKCLKMIGGSDNVMGVTMCFREMNHIVIVMPYFPHDSFSDYVGSLTTSELQDYIRNLLIALRRVHHFKIIHRDVKPANFLYSRKHRRYSLVDFGLAQEVSSLKRESSHVLSPPTLDTPHLTSNKTAKRKLSAFAQDENESEKGKRSRHFSPPTSASSGVLSSTSNRVNAALRRSPRKQCSLSVSPKENFITPRKTNSVLIPQDSPRKHTRNAEAGLRSGTSKDYGSKTPNQYPKLKPEAIRGLRRSPRKTMSSTLNGPLEGLAKYLLEATATNAKTPYIKGESYHGECTPNGDSSLLNNTLSRKQPHSVACSPRVSGITDSHSHNQDKSNSVKSNRVLQEVQTKSGSMLKPVSCHCYGSARVCSVCITRNTQHAPRAGTPGFRAPEVLLRNPDQGTAVDMWSVGVILMCLLSGRYPFFRAVDDHSTLAEISTLLGTYSIRKAAAKFGKLFTSSEERRPLDLMKICEVLRNNTLKSDNDNSCGAKLEDHGICPGCHQRGICVCLAPAKVISCVQSFGHPNKKRTLSFDSSLSKDQLSKINSSPQLSQTLLMKNMKCMSMKQTSQFLQNGCNYLPESLSLSGTNPNPQICNINMPPAENGSTNVLSNSPNRPQAEKSNKNSKEIVYPSSVYHLLIRFLDPDPETRITAEEALNHPFLKSQYT